MDGRGSDAFDMALMHFCTDAVGRLAGGREHCQGRAIAFGLPHGANDSADHRGLPSSGRACHDRQRPSEDRRAAFCLGIDSSFVLLLRFL